MIKKRNITKEELLFVQLCCDWSDPQVRMTFAHQGLYINILENDLSVHVRWATSQFKAYEEYELLQYKKIQNPTRNYR